MIASKLSNPSRRFRALIADDDASVRRLLRVLLEAEGCTVEEVADGAEALARARAAPPDLLVTDAVMPRMDGFSLCRAIREDPRLQHLPVLLASASFRAPYDEQLALAAGASAFLGKPAAIADWQGAIHLALTSHPPQPMPDSDFTALRAEVLGELLVNRQGELTDKRARLNESETRFRDILDNLDDLVFLADPSTGHLFNANRRACEFLGLSSSGGIEAADSAGGAHEAFGRSCAGLTSVTVAELGPPEKAEAVRRALREVIEKGNRVFECNLRRHDGALVPYEVNARLTVLEGRDVIVGLARDISERKHAEQALHDSEERFRATFEQAAVGIAQVAPDGRWLHMNRKLCDIVGYSREELLQRSFQDITYPDDLDADLAFVRRMLAGDIQTYGMEKRYLRKDGSLVWIYLTVGLVRLPTGEPKYFISVVEDITERKQAEAALRQSEQRLRDLIDGLSPQMFVGLMTSEGILIEVNRPALAAAGLKREDVLGKRVDQTYWWSYSEEVQQRLRASVLRVAEGEATRYDAQVRVGVNQFIYIDLSLQPLRDETGKVQYLVGSANVITERKLAEQALYESEERLRLALDAAHMGTFDWDIPANRIAWSRWHEELWGFKPGEFAGIYESFSSRVHPEDLPGINAEVERCIAAREPFAREFRVVWPDGSVHWIAGRGEFAFGPDGQALRMRGVVVDITARKQAEEKLRASEIQLRLFVEHSPAAIAMFDNEMRYLVASRRWSEDYRLRDQDVIGRSHYEVFADVPERWKEVYRRCLAGAIERCEEDPFPRADGHVDWVRWEVRPWRKASGEIGGILIFSEVITAAKEAEHKIAEDAQRLEQLSRRLLAAQEDERRNVARELHDEIGQLLTVVKLDLQAVLRQPGTAALAPALKEGMESIDRVVARVRDLSLDLRPSMLDDLGLVPALRWYAQRQAKRADLALTLTLPNELPRLPGEIETVCFRVAQEALTNIARHAGAHRVELTLATEERGLRLRVSDDGVGFDPEAVRRDAGAAFGLLGMRERAELAGGEFHLDSRPGRGTTVEVRFSVAATEGGDGTP